MSVARHHAEWLSLVEISGPFLSIPVLQRAFPQGLVAHDPEHLKNLRLAYEEWQEGMVKPAIHSAWIRYILTETLQFPDEVITAGQTLPPGLEVNLAEFGERLRPDFAIVNPTGHENAGKPRLLVQVLAPGQSLDRPAPGSRWKASPATRMMELLHAVETPLGLVTNGEQWMLVFAPLGEATGFTSWYASIWLEEHITLRALRTLLGVRSFFGVADSDTIDALLVESSRDQQEVTEQLGLQVRRAVEVLVQTLDRIDRERNGELLQNIPPRQLYEAALTVMMRLVFLFSAEERGLLLLGDPLYDQYYAVSTLSAQLRETADLHGEEVLERFKDAWSRLLATFRVVYGGVAHDALQVRAYGGRLFDPDRFPFLEGRMAGTSWRQSPADPLPIDNRTVLHLLEALQFLLVKAPGGVTERRRLSFRALDIEQIGHVYEGLLDHTAVRAGDESPVLSLAGSKDKEPEVELIELERLLAKGEADLIQFLKEQTGRTPSAITNALHKTLAVEEQQRLRFACGNDEQLFARVSSFAGLIRDDTFGRPVVIAAGSVFVTAGTDRRESGTHYTPRTLTEPMVQHALEPLVFDGPAEGKPKSEWKLRSARELLQIKVCDLTMGSGAFLVQTCRYLSERLVEAWEMVISADPETLRITPEGVVSNGLPGDSLIPVDPDERLAYARRIVCDRCLYGVDKNPMAVDMAKLSLWLITLDKGRAFTFLDHALKTGDSLLGLHTIEQIEHFHMTPEHADPQLTTWWRDITAELWRQALEKRKELESFVVNDVRDSQRKQELLAEVDSAMERVRIVCDLLVGAAISTADGESRKRSGLPAKVFEDRRAQAWGLLLKNYQRDDTGSAHEAIQSLKTEALALLNAGNHPGQLERRPFHWPLEFPEVFANGSAGGFSAIVSNPPFQGGKKITGVLGTDYRLFLMDFLANGQKGHADLCAYFFLRAAQLIRAGGGFGMLATNTIAQGDTREVGLDQLKKAGLVIPRAVSSQKWPGSASLEVAHVWVRKGKWSGEHTLNGKSARGITSFLAIAGKVQGKPYRLAANADKSFIGSYVLGTGFILSSEEAQRLIEKDPCNADVIFPYLNGEDLNSRYDQSASRFVIDFRDWPLSRTARGSWTTATVEERRYWIDEGCVPRDYPAEVAEDYPDLLNILKQKVMPVRVRRKPNGAFVLRKPLPQRWWHYADKRPLLYRTVHSLNQVLVIAIVSRTVAFSFVAPTQVYAHKLAVFAFDDFSSFGILQSSYHYIWAWLHSSTMKADLNYSPSDCFETFPFPESNDGLDGVGRDYYLCRQSIMQSRREGLTKTHGRLHNPNEHDTEMVKLRELHKLLDQAVAAAYGWTEIKLNHDFYDTSQGIRFTICEAARCEILDRLLALNHKRYAEEVAAGLHEKTRQGGKKKTVRKKSDKFQGEQLRLGL